jgi:hypothetical protein
MAPRLPIPGGDDDEWGNILNAYLEISHNPDGTLIPTAVASAGALLNGSAAGGDLSGTFPNPTVSMLQGINLTTTGATNGQVLTYSTTSNSWSPSTVSGSVVSDASNSTKGIIELAGDLAPGTNGAANPKVNTVLAGQTPVSTSTSLGGDLSGNLPSPSVAKIQGTSISAPSGGATSYLNATGTWTTPAGGGNMSTSTYDPAGIAQQVVGTTATQTLSNKSISGSQITSAVASATNATTATTATTANGLNSATTTVVVNGATAPTSGQVLTASSSTAASWVNPTTGGAQALAPTTVKTSAYTASSGDFVPVDTSSGSVTITLPSAPADKSRVEIKMINTASGNIVTINTAGSDVFNKSGGNTSSTLNVLNQAVMLQYTSATAIWYVQSDDLPQSSVVMGYSHTITGTYTMVSTDHVIMADATSAAFTITLPTAVGFSGRYTIDAVTSTTNIVTLNTTSSQTIDGSSSTTLGTGASGAYWTSVDLVSDGANWHTV